jgi:hypothetical protein
LTEKGQDIDEEQLQTLKEKYRTILSLCDKKVNLANATYQLLDDCICKLDMDLRKVGRGFFFSLPFLL